RCATLWTGAVSWPAGARMIPWIRLRVRPLTPHLGVAALSLRHRSSRNFWPLRPGMRPFLILSAGKQELQWTGIWAKPSGARLAGHSNFILAVVENSPGPASDAYSPIS